MLNPGRILAACVGVLMAAGVSRGVVLYDGSAGTSPQAQGWLSYYSLPGTGVQTVAGGATTYDSTASGSERGGVSNDSIFGVPVNGAFPALDRSAGYTVSLDMRMLGESHTSTDRAGVSLIVLGADHMGVELGFWGNEIWAQSGPTFTHAEGISRDTTAAGGLANGETRYDLAVSGTTYTLSADGAPVLTGALRDYSSFGFPYTIPSYLFLGDDTTSAAGKFEVSRLAVAVPEPGVVVMGVTPLLLLAQRRR